MIAIWYTGLLLLFQSATLYYFVIGCLLFSVSACFCMSQKFNEKLECIYWKPVKSTWNKNTSAAYLSVIRDGTSLTWGGGRIPQSGSCPHTHLAYLWLVRLIMCSFHSNAHFGTKPSEAERGAAGCPTHGCRGKENGALDQATAVLFNKRHFLEPQVSGDYFLPCADRIQLIQTTSRPLLSNTVMCPKQECESSVFNDCYFVNNLLLYLF